MEFSRKVNTLLFNCKLDVKIFLKEFGKLDSDQQIVVIKNELTDMLHLLSGNRSPEPLIAVLLIQVK